MAATTDSSFNLLACKGNFNRCNFSHIHEKFIETYIQGTCKAPFHKDHDAKMEIKIKESKHKEKQQTERKLPDH